MPMKKYREIIRNSSPPPSIPPSNHNNNNRGSSGFFIILGIIILIAVIGFIVSTTNNSGNTNYSNNNNQSDTSNYSARDDTSAIEQKRDDRSDEYILPYSDSEYISYSDLSELTKEEVALARNEIFARRGRRFSTDSIREYFKSKSWYNPTYNPDEFPESIFNMYEKENITTIVKYEKEKGWK